MCPHLFSRKSTTTTTHTPTKKKQSDPGLEQHRRALVTAAAQTLRASQMAVFDERSGNLYVTGESNSPVHVAIVAPPDQAA